MKKLQIVFLFISLFAWRWVSTDSPLPSSWTPQSKIRFTATILEEPEYTDTKTIIRSGIWYIPLKGYAEIIPGSKVSFTGKVEPVVLMGKVTKIVMKDPTFDVVSHARCVRSLHSECMMITLGKLRVKWVEILEKTLPEPMSSLAAGILLGVRAQMPQEFYESLVSTGTLHIVAASGYNVSVMATLVMRLATILFRRGIGISIAIVGIIVYVLIAGASASVVRAGIMGSLTLIAYYFGRPTEAKRLLWITGGIMLLHSPLLIFDVGFQLSFAATLGLLYFGPIFQNLDTRLRLSDGIKMFFGNYLYPTLAASIATLPIIAFHFGRVSWISPLVNMMVLPVVPLIMGITSFVIAFGTVNLHLGQIFSWIAYVPLFWLVKIIQLFSF